jgi:hypothetical protein
MKRTANADRGWRQITKGGLLAEFLDWETYDLL